MLISSFFLNLCWDSHSLYCFNFSSIISLDEFIKCNFVIYKIFFIFWVGIEERLESLYIINCELQVQEEALYRLGNTTLRKENTNHHT